MLPYRIRCYVCKYLLTCCTINQIISASGYIVGNCASVIYIKGLLKLNLTTMRKITSKNIIFLVLLLFALLTFLNTDWDKAVDGFEKGYNDASEERKVQKIEASK